jgi:MFS family permease
LRTRRLSLSGVLVPTISLSFSAFLVMFAEAMLYPALPVIQTEFHITKAEASWIFTSYLIAGSLAVSLIGRLADIYGRKKLLLAIQSLFGIALILNSLAPTYIGFIGARALQGLGITISPLAYAIIKDQLPSEKVPVAQGLVSGMTGIGLVTALPVGGWIADHLGWRSIFMLTAIMAVFSLIANVLTLKETKASLHEFNKDSGPNLVNVLLFALFLMSLLAAASTIASETVPLIIKIILVIIAVIAFVFFQLREKSSANPLIPLDALDMNMRIAMLGSFAIAISFQMDIFVLAYLLQNPIPSGYGLSTSEVGIYMVVIILAYALSSPLGGRIVTLIGPRKVISLGAILASIGYIVAAYDPVSNLNIVISMLSLGSAGRAIINTSLVSLVTFSAKEEYLATSTSLYSLMRYIGSAIGPIISGILLTLYPSPQVYTINYLIISLIFVLIFMSIRLVSDKPLKTE